MSFHTFIKATLCLFFLLATLPLASCGGGGSGGGVGTLSTALTDASSDMYQAVYVTIVRVEVHAASGGGWQTVANPNATYNLLELVNGVRETLGIAQLDAGHYTQMRLVLGDTPDAGINILSLPHPFANYVIDLSDTVQELTVPSGMTTGVKLVNGFDIMPNETTELILDFDAMQSVVIAGSSGKYQLKPTIKVLDSEAGAIVSGVVTTPGAPPIPLGGTLVTAQIAVPTAPDPKDQVVIDGGTVSADDGGYALFLAAGDYNLVAVKDGYQPACTVVSLLGGSLTTLDLSLDPTPVAPGSITGTVSITGAPPEQVVTIDFRQEITCAGAAGAADISVHSVNVANGGAFDVPLPAGTYLVVASTFGQTTQEIGPVSVISATPTDIGDVAF